MEWGSRNNITNVLARVRQHQTVLPSLAFLKQDMSVLACQECMSPDDWFLWSTFSRVSSGDLLQRDHASSVENRATSAGSTHRMPCCPTCVEDEIRVVFSFLKSLLIRVMRHMAWLQQHLEFRDHCVVHWS